MNQSKTSFTVIRHGETEWNLKGLHQGILDSPLTDKGREQACKLAELLQKDSFDMFYSSDLGRAVQTAQIIAASIHLNIVYDQRLRERNLGRLGGQTLNRFQAEDPEGWARYVKRDPDYIVPGGESASQAYARSIACFEEWAHKLPDHNILVVTHGFILEYLLRYTLGIPLDQKIRFSLKNCGINRFSKIGNEWVLDTWGEMGHSEVKDGTVYPTAH
jgi:2,3-bisphosphoglycerate-dependent phosphoglycerate mutase